MPATILGIRHHGPGSATSLINALQVLQPDIILIEGPPDADPLIAAAADKDMAPPVALLVFNPKNLSQASFFPFALFSPEWQAILFGLKHRIAVQFIDLPMSINFALHEPEVPAEAELFQEPDIRRSEDPFSEIAALAGYDDPERWWEALVERQHHAGENALSVFESITFLFSELRQAKKQPETRETHLREAWMRQQIRKAEQAGYKQIAVVCGAWHSPALAQTHQFSASADAGHLRNLKKIKTASTWIPWSFDRLARAAGYGAGVTAPAWYQLLFESMQRPDYHPEQAISTWMTSAAHLLRQHDFPVSPGHVIEAVRLADALAKLRQTHWPGIEALRESAITVLCEGAEKRYELIEQKLVIGDVLGAIPDHLPAPALKADFEALAKSLRLAKSTAETSLELDLRKDAHTEKSRFLHRLNILELPWGTIDNVGGNKQGRFHENWKLKWQPDFEIKLIEAGIWGNTVTGAAATLAMHRIKKATALPELANWLALVLKADLIHTISPLIGRIREAAAQSADAVMLADTVVPLAEIARYGSARQLDAEAIDQLLEHMIPRVCAQLPGACLLVEEDLAKTISKTVLAFNRAIGILSNSDFDSWWQDALRDIFALEAAAPQLAGTATRLLFDKQKITPATIENALHFRLSKGQHPADAALWLEGFLQGSGLLLLHHPALWRLLDDWIAVLNEAAFTDLLPVLRRTFSRFPEPEREKMLSLAAQGERPVAVSENTDDWDTQRAAAADPLIQLLFEG